MRRIAELDALRGLAALAIVVYHFWLIRCPGLGTAVDLFFVLSGYLITTIILKSDNLRGLLVPFYARRALRIWPIYYLTLLAVIAVNRFQADPTPLSAWPYYATYTQGLPLYWLSSAPSFPPAFRHTWTLAIEEQFYLVWPALLYLFGRKNIIPLCCAFMFGSIASRAVGYPPWLLLSHSEGLALGALLACVMSERNGNLPPDKARWRLLGLAATGAVLLVALAKLAPSFASGTITPALAQSVNLFGWNLLMFSIVGSVVAGSGTRALGWLRWRPLCYLGQISYGIYLYHHVLHDYLKPVTDRYSIVISVATLGLAIISWELVEKPILSLKSRFPYRPSVKETLPAAQHGLPEAASWEPAT